MLDPAPEDRGFDVVFALAIAIVLFVALGLAYLAVTGQ